jgi:hypothetical protein
MNKEPNVVELCPFCGSEAHLSASYERGWARAKVQCLGDHCGALISIEREVSFFPPDDNSLKRRVLLQMTSEVHTRWTRRPE